MAGVTAGQGECTGQRDQRGQRPWVGKEHVCWERPVWLGRARSGSVPGGLIHCPLSPCSPGHPDWHQRLYRVLSGRLPRGAVSPGGEVPSGPRGHPLWLVPGPGLDQFHRRAAHGGSLPDSSPRAQPETEAGPGHLSRDAWSWWQGGWAGADLRPAAGTARWARLSSQYLCRLAGVCCVSMCAAGGRGSAEPMK